MHILSNSIKIVQSGKYFSVLSQKSNILNLIFYMFNFQISTTLFVNVYIYDNILYYLNMSLLRGDTMSEILEKREIPRINVKLFAHASNTASCYGSFSNGFISDLSHWGAKIKLQRPIDIDYPHNLSFTFNNVNYTIPFSVIETLNGNVYRIKFIFNDFLILSSLKLQIENYLMDKKH